MNKIKFLVFTCFLTFAISCGQQKRYVTYKIQEGETMKVIANRLDIRTKDLLKLNPDVGRKPKANTNIIIPNPKLKNTSSVTSSDKGLNSEGNISSNDVDTVKSDDLIDTSSGDGTKVLRTSYEYVTHTVNPKETVYSLTKKYGLTKAELLELNPEYPTLKNNELSIGQVLKVEAKEVKTYVSLEEELKDYVTHTVKSKETMYGLTRFYNVSKEDLIRLNPDSPALKNNDLQIGQVIKIRKLEDALKSDEVLFFHDTIVENTSINLAVLLPFEAKEYDSVPSKDIFKEKVLTNMVTDFYMGLEIAVDSIKQQGIDVNVSVFDTGNKGNNINQILNENKLDLTDVVIGPFYANKVEMIARKINSPVVFPHFSKKQDQFSSNKIVKSEPDIEYHTSFLASYLKSAYNGETIFIVGDGKGSSNKQVSKLMYDLKRHDSISKVIVLKPKDGYIKKARFTDEMKPKSKCWLIMASDDNAVVADALNSMIVLPDGVTVQVFAVKKNKAYKKIDNNKLARVQFTYATNNFNDTKSIDTKVFNKKYKNKNKAIPSQYSVKGFDVTYDVLMRLASGEKLLDTYDKGASLRLETKFDFDKKSFATTNNKGLFIVKYNTNLSLERLK